MVHIRIFYFSLFLIFSQAAYSQIAAPIFRCVRHDTLLWDKPNVTCGAFNRYIIYSARNRSGPYAVLANVNNPNTTFFYNAFTNGEVHYYYLQSDFSCPGQSRLSSDTLSNEPPPLTPIATATVIDNRHVEIIWSRSFSPQAAGYIVYKKTAVGLIPLDTVRSKDTLQYIDSTATPGIQSETYQVLGLDVCGNASLFDKPHSTILLRSQQSKCDQSIALRWNLYQNWRTPIARQELWVGVHGRFPYLFATLGAADTAFTFKGVVNKESYRFYIVAVQSGAPAFTSRSNDRVDTANVIQPVRSLILENVNVNPANHIEIIWTWNADAQIDSFRILRSTDRDTGYIVVSSQKATFPLDEENTFTDTADARKQVYYYKIQTKDQCGAADASNLQSTVLLKAKTTGPLQNQLTWSPLVVPGGKILQYQVYRILKGAVNTVGIPLDSTKLAYADEVGQDAANACYFIGSRYQYTAADGSLQETEARSNVACVQQYARLFAPNAFTPGGHNPEFKPVINFGENIGTYSMIVLNRWGDVLFQTADPAAGWDGKKNGVDLPQGPYAYYIQITQNSVVTESKGIVMLIR